MPAPAAPAATAKPVVVVLVDVHGWAWDRKAQQLAMYLGDEFDVRLHYTTDGKPVPHGVDLYHTFEFPQTDLLLDHLRQGARIVTGLTAHVLPTWGADRVAKWARRAVALHANSLLLAREIAPLHPRVYYVPNGVDASYWRRTRPRAPSAKLVVGHVGKPNPRKGLAEFIEPAARAADAELRVVSRRSQDALTSGEVREFYQDLHVLAVASDFDGTPNPALEAASCEVAVVSNPIGNMPEFIRHGANGLLAERSVAALAAAFRALAADIPRAVAMGQRAREAIVDGWTWRAQAENYRHMWRDALGLPAVKL